MKPHYVKLTIPLVRIGGFLFPRKYHSLYCEEYVKYVCVYTAEYLKFIVFHSEVLYLSY